MQSVPHDRPSRAFIELTNLLAAAQQHKSECAGEECAVSLQVLRMTGERLLPLVNADEYARAREIVSAAWPM